MGQNLKLLVDERRPIFFGTWKRTQFFGNIEDNLHFFVMDDYLNCAKRSILPKNTV
jgi:hypothetical protein